jgi:hypothetical protein
VSVATFSIHTMTQQLIGGASPFGYFVVVPEKDLVRAERHIRAVLDAKTYREARACDAPGADDDQFSDAEPYDVRDLGVIDDGDWPPNAAMVALATLPEEVRALAAPEMSMVGQEWLEFDLAKVGEIVGTLEAMGHAVRRDDAAIQSFDELGSI